MYGALCMENETETCIQIGIIFPTLSQLTVMAFLFNIISSYIKTTCRAFQKPVKPTSLSLNRNPTAPVPTLQTASTQAKSFITIKLTALPTVPD